LQSISAGYTRRHRGQCIDFSLQCEIELPQLLKGYIVNWAFGEDSTIAITCIADPICQVASIGQRTFDR
jgi:hypothetical protein